MSDIIDGFAENEFNRPETRNDVLNILEKSIRNKTLKNEVVNSISKSKQVNLSKISNKNKDMDKSANKEAQKKKKQYLGKNQTNKQSLI